MSPCLRKLTADRQRSLVILALARDACAILSCLVTIAYPTVCVVSMIFYYALCYHRLYLHLFPYCIFKLLFSYMAIQPQV